MLSKYQSFPSNYQNIPNPNPNHPKRFLLYQDKRSKQHQFMNYRQKIKAPYWSYNRDQSVHQSKNKKAKNMKNNLTN